MPRFSAHHIPRYFRHKCSGQAAVKIAGRFVYLGRYDSPKSRQRYEKVISEWFAAGRCRAVLEARQEAPEALNVEQVIAAFWIHARSYYRDPEGNPTQELQNFTDALRTLRRLYGKTLAVEFGPRCLKACQADMIVHGLARNTINRRIGRIRQVFKWAVSDEMLPSSVFEGLRTVDGLKRGRSDARETTAVKPVTEMHAQAAMKHAGRHIAAMIELQLITGMRSGELVIMRTSDIDRTGPVWVYTPTKHKTQHHGHSRAVYLGQRGQAILTPFIKLDPTAYLFSPAEAECERRAALSEARKTPTSSGNRAGTNRKSNPKRAPGNRYTDATYARAVARACDKAFPASEQLDVPSAKTWRKSHRFHPHQLRHAAATRFRRDYNLETARALLGQKSMDAAEIYAEMDMNKARDVMGKTGVVAKLPDCTNASTKSRNLIQRDLDRWAWLSAAGR